MGLQFGVLPTAEPTSSFKILRSRDRATLAINPFRPDGLPTIQTGVAMITGADEAVATHQRVAEQMWRECLKGAAGAAQIRRMMQQVLSTSCRLSRAGTATSSSLARWASPG